MFKDPVLRTVSILMIPVIILYGLYIQFHGDYSPGGGFQAGVIVASAIILHGILFGLKVTLKVISPYIVRLIGGIGILIYGGTGIASMLLGGEFLSYSTLASDPVLGQKLGIFLVELGVGMTVCSSMLTIFFNFVSSYKE
ncbi:Na+/H+ antiporter family protein [Ehrlichia chaffeensis str. Heartland]|uniref:Na(+)/H(+) antiporter subunit B n=1 Tax=Ehrlichia chaffeensis TaxID=945 RepID=UPI00031824C7|nr:Na(+)/H(+) antiporter subunit B [Ehrlichia chaffeensis]AHX03566.1 Na+/H+ antiporter family protein [Ehrlichia chaffeensis str. Heartland]AHX05713.1 Na+/H+ antiporter family protein [Ehrlichia chaffeensis str. Jax]AHX06705.1 Na+/H+ antiporter family protein [Ehrlichia chaffeensis str. Liberty]AHX07444.1 Na+/H+ antiporter family protein [Ehrlichia chaffeensis str. Osceola]AHX08272.1 Na+/H+ antiporter family protein [Ehrlichia chaffeensis str. Saint Vincent]